MDCDICAQDSLLCINVYREDRESSRDSAAGNSQHLPVYTFFEVAKDKQHSKRKEGANLIH